ncbi:methionyl-tRNA formyltransferase [Patiriisocius marinus]|uniref:Methionyl-tRNA formyltransferase n=1 Tax=Patiriisocius marinus TaxID=1397112 RepID=A0A5J4J4E3_9FLAO|nr:methionyl-tRNA formyltransferase [Patiriisocius marinus]GER59347.1 methionyl-tRNA formyltransferase [Patiriisocius marinus]
MTTEKLRIVFMGTPEFAVGILDALIADNQNIVGVITAPDRPSGRGRKLTPSAVKKVAIEKNIPVLQPTNLKNKVFLTELKELNADLQIVVAFRMLPKVVWSMPKKGTFNLHASLLPQYRGAAPINWAIINQEKKTGVTTFFIDEKIDTGEIIDAKEVKIKPNETIGSLHDTLKDLGSILVVETVHKISSGPIITKPQPKGDNFKKLKLNEAPKLTPENTYIDWTKSGEEINAFVRGLNPYPGAWSFMKEDTDEDSKNLKVKLFEVNKLPIAISEIEIEQLNAILELGKDKVTGELFVIGKKLYIKSSSETLEILEIQLPGKRRMKTKDLLNGYSFKPKAKMIVKPHSH